METTFVVIEGHLTRLIALYFSDGVSTDVFVSPGEESDSYRKHLLEIIARARSIGDQGNEDMAAPRKISHMFYPTVFILKDTIVADFPTFEDAREHARALLRMCTTIRSEQHYREDKELNENKTPPGFDNPYLTPVEYTDDDYWVSRRSHEYLPDAHSNYMCDLCGSPEYALIHSVSSEGEPPEREIPEIAPSGEMESSGNSYSLFNTKPSDSTPIDDKPAAPATSRKIQDSELSKSLSDLDKIIETIASLTFQYTRHKSHGDDTRPDQEYFIDSETLDMYRFSPSDNVHQVWDRAAQTWTMTTHVPQELTPVSEDAADTDVLPVSRPEEVDDYDLIRPSFAELDTESWSPSDDAIATAQTLASVTLIEGVAATIVAIVDELDKTAVLSLHAVLPKTPESPTRAFERQNGAWVLDEVFLELLNPPDPPPTVVLKESEILDVIGQVDFHDEEKEAKRRESLRSFMLDWGLSAEFGGIISDEDEDFDFGDEEA